MWASLSSGTYWKPLIYPQRKNYTMKDLGPRTFYVNQLVCKRTDFEVVSSIGCVLQCSHFEPIEQERPQVTLPCVIYLHGNSGSRPEGLFLVQHMLLRSITTVLFDYAGSGMSEGEYVTLGWNESDDLGRLIKHLRGRRHVGAIGLWGRSMGAATALLYTKQNPLIACLVLDSPYSDLKSLILSIGSEYTKIPGFIVKLVYRRMKKNIMKQTRVNIGKIKPIDAARQINCPAVFIYALDDALITESQTQALYKAFAGEKAMIYTTGDHNSQRAQGPIYSAVNFLTQTLT